MELILLQDIDKVGDKFTIVTVKNGFGRNYLIPQGVALVANQANRNRLTELLRQEDRRENKRLDEYKQLVNQLHGTKVTVQAKSGTSGRIFGSITNVLVANAIAEQVGIKLERKKVVFLTEIKELGTHDVMIQLSKDVTATINLEVVAQA